MMRPFNTLWNLACYPPPLGFNEKYLLILSNLTHQVA
jgi:hypothetical protein